MLKTLALGSFFNIVSFGTKHEFIFDTCLEATDDNIDMAIERVDQFHADMENTELLQCFTEVIESTLSSRIQ